MYVTYEGLFSCIIAICAIVDCLNNYKKENNRHASYTFGDYFHINTR